MTNRDKTKRLFNLILQYYMLYKESTLTRDEKNIKELRKIVYEIGILSKELNYDVTLHTTWAPIEEEFYHLKRYYQAELDRLYPSNLSIMKRWF